jgi:hypothetical protein
MCLNFKYHNVPIQQQTKIFSKLIFLKRESGVQSHSDLDGVVQFPPSPTHNTCLLCSAMSGLMKLACLIFLKRKHEKFRDQHGKIIQYKARLVMDGSRAHIGVDVFDTYAPVIDHSIVRLFISLSFGKNWEMFHKDISVNFTNA